LNGIDVANNWIVIGVSPEARLSTVRVAGVQIESSGAESLETPSAGGDIATQTVSTDDAAKRFKQGMEMSGKAHHIHWSKKMYYMPAGAREAIVEPRLVVRFNEELQTSEGTIAGRARIAGVPLADPTSPISEL
jgi:hypothetical protein